MIGMIFLRNYILTDAIMCETEEDCTTDRPFCHPKYRFCHGNN